jgi:hypothetical protein
MFQDITGLLPPDKSVTAQEYADQGYSFFEEWEEPTTVAGHFLMVKSIGQIDSNIELQLNRKTFKGSEKRRSAIRAQKLLELKPSARNRSEQG